VTVVTEPRGQLVTVGAQLVTVPVDVVYTVEVVYSVISVLEKLTVFEDLDDRVFEVLE